MAALTRPVGLALDLAQRVVDLLHRGTGLRREREVSFAVHGDRTPFAGLLVELHIPRLTFESQRVRLGSQVVGLPLVHRPFGEQECRLLLEELVVLRVGADRRRLSSPASRPVSARSRTSPVTPASWPPTPWPQARPSSQVGRRPSSPVQGASPGPTPFSPPSCRLPASRRGPLSSPRASSSWPSPSVAPAPSSWRQKASPCPSCSSSGRWHLVWWFRPFFAAGAAFFDSRRIRPPSGTEPPTMHHRRGVQSVHPATRWAGDPTVPGSMRQSGVGRVEGTIPAASPRSYGPLRTPGRKERAGRGPARSPVVKTGAAVSRRGRPSREERVRRGAAGDHPTGVALARGGRRSAPGRSGPCPARIGLPAGIARSARNFSRRVRAIPKVPHRAA